jgi:glycosyltransferase involved in cell wall biosynthesis
MRIGIDARFFGPVGKGLGRYTERLIQNLERVSGSDHRFAVFLRKENFDRYMPAAPNFRKVLADFRWYSLEEQLRFPPLLRKEGIDLMHFPHFNVPLFTPCPFVVTIHDLILFRYPTRRATTLNAPLYALKYAAYRLVIASAVKRACRIITVSECTKRDIVEAFRTDPRRIEVTYEASDPPSSEVPGRGIDETLKSKRIVKPFFLYVGNAYPHKNLEALLSAFKKLRREGLEAQLVLVGKMDYFYGRLEREADRLGLTGSADVVFYGFADDLELADLYRRARAYVFPSLLEGFGLPPLEAMRYGTPVAASDSSCLPEILGDAAAWFDPGDPEAMPEVMRRIFEDEPFRASLREKGVARAGRYDWKDCAERTYRTYLSCLRS